MPSPGAVRWPHLAKLPCSTGEWSNMSLSEEKGSAAQIASPEAEPEEILGPAAPAHTAPTPHDRRRLQSQRFPVGAQGRAGGKAGPAAPLGEKRLTDSVRGPSAKARIAVTGLGWPDSPGSAALSASKGAMP